MEHRSRDKKITLIYVFEMSFSPSPSPSSCPFEGELRAMGWVKGEDCMQPTEVINSIKFGVYFVCFALFLLSCLGKSLRHA